MSLWDEIKMSYHYWRDILKIGPMTSSTSSWLEYMQQQICSQMLLFTLPGCFEGMDPDALKEEEESDTENAEGEQ